MELNLLNGSRASWGDMPWTRSGFDMHDFSRYNFKAREWRTHNFGLEAHKGFCCTFRVFSEMVQLLAGRGIIYIQLTVRKVSYYSALFLTSPGPLLHCYYCSVVVMSVQSGLLEHCNSSK
jgi:hypothetical protein